MADEPVQRRGGEERGAGRPRTHGGQSPEHLCCSLSPRAGEHTVFICFTLVLKKQAIKNHHRDISHLPCGPSGGAASEEQEVCVAEAAVQTAQACGCGLFPHGSALQSTQVRLLVFYIWKTKKESKCQ